MSGKKEKLISNPKDKKYHLFLKRQLNMTITRIDQYPSNDFTIENNHARMSQRKVAQVTLVSLNTVNKYINVRITDDNIRQEVINKGMDGVRLKEFVTYIALDSKRISDEVRNHNIKLLSDASDFGFQMLIDKMAGIEPMSVSNEQQLFQEYCQVTDLIFQNTHIKPELIAGVKLSQAEKLLPHLADTLRSNRQLLVEATASEVKLMTPTEIGKRLGSKVSAQKVNKMLIDAGLQIKNTNKKSRKDVSYLPTDKGHEFCSFTISTGKEGDTTSYQQLLWYESVLNVIG